MPTIALRDAEGTDIGFMLIAGDEAIVGGPSQRDLIMMKLPLPSASTLSAFIDEYRHTEFVAQVVGSTLSFEVAPGLVVQASLSSSGEGSWSVASLGSGSCQVLAQK